MSNRNVCEAWGPPNESANNTTSANKPKSPVKKELKKARDAINRPLYKRSVPSPATPQGEERKILARGLAYAAGLAPLVEAFGNRQERRVVPSSS